MIWYELLLVSDSVWKLGSHTLILVEKKWMPEAYMAYPADKVLLDRSTMQIWMILFGEQSNVFIKEPISLTRTDEKSCNGATLILLSRGKPLASDEAVPDSFAEFRRKETSILTVTAANQAAELKRTKYMAITYTHTCTNCNRDVWNVEGWGHRKHTRNCQNLQGNKGSKQNHIPHSMLISCHTEG